MKLVEFCTKRPVTTLMFYIGVVLFGLISVSLLPRELFPPITYPQLSVVTPYANAAPEEIETLITRPIEEAVGSVSGLRKVSSTSKEGLSLVVADFGWNQNMDFAALAVREKIDLVKERLPRDAQEPIVVKFNPFELPVMTLSIASSKRSPVELRRVALKRFKDELEKVLGVASVSVTGGEEEEILVEVDQARLRGAGVSIVDVTDSVANANLNYPGGTIKESFYEYLVRTLGEFKNEEDIKNVSIAQEVAHQTQEEAFFTPPEKSKAANRLILLKDVADIHRRVKERTSFSRFNGLENVTISVQKQALSNTIQIVNAVKERLKEIQKSLPADISVNIVYDQSSFIRTSLLSVRDAALQGGFLAFLVLLIFLKDARSSAFVIMITPITVLATYTLMLFSGISLNVISLGGIALGIGMLVDNAVVVIENVYRHFKESGDIQKAAIEGSQEVVGAMTASTLTNVMVFLPMVFVKGIAGQVFKELAWVVVVTQFVSLVIAFTLLPMLISKAGSSKGIGQERQVSKRSIIDWVGAPLDWVLNRYRSLLPSLIKQRRVVISLIFILFAFSLFLLNGMDKTLMPKIDQGQFLMRVDLPVGTRVEVTNQVAQLIERSIRKIKEVKEVTAIVGSTKGDSSQEILERLGSHQAHIIVNLDPKRKRSTEQVVQELRSQLKKARSDPLFRMTNIDYVLYESAFKAGAEQDAPIVIQVKGPNLEMLKKLALNAQDRIVKIPGIAGVSNSLPDPSPETKVVINKDRASYYNLSVTDIAKAAHVAIRGIVTTKLKEEGNEIDIKVRLRESDRDRLSKLNRILIHSQLGIDIPLTELVVFTKGRGPSEIKRISQERTIEVYVKFYKESLSKMTEKVQNGIKTLKVPAGYSVKIAGESLEIQESFDSLKFAFILAIVLVYMIMAAQFESIWQPFLIMITVPLSLIGVAIALVWTSTPISVVVILGIILLGGIVVNNGIILIDFLNLNRSQGASYEEAAVEAGRTRVRPILMTALSSAIGLVPLALGIGEGAELQAPLAITVMGGLLVATILTLMVLPSLYIGFENLKKRFLISKKS